MNNDNMSKVYREQSILILDTLELIKNRKLSSTEYQQMLILILIDYAEFLWATADLMDSVTAISDIKFIKRANHSEPPFEKDFFKNHKDI